MLLICRDEFALCARPVDLGPRQGVQVLVAARGVRARYLATHSAHRGVRSTIPADMLGLDGMSQLNAQPADATHPGSNHHARRIPEHASPAARFPMFSKPTDDRRVSAALSQIKNTPSRAAAPALIV